MPNFYYAPGVQDRRGELVAQGISQAGQSISDAITTAKRKHDENKAYSQLADVLGLDPEHSTKLDVQAAMLKNELLQARQQQQQKQNAWSAMSKFSKVFQNNRVGGPDPIATLALGRGPLKNQVVKPPMSPGDAAMGAFSAVPEIFGDPKAASTAASIAKMTNGMNDGGITIDPNTGLPVLRSGNSARVINPAWLNGGRIPSNLKFTPGPENTEFWTFGNRGGQVRTPTDNSNRGMLPPGTKFQTINGKTVAVTPDGWMKPVAGGATDEFTAINNQVKAETNGGAAPSAQEETNAPAAGETTFTEGQQVKQNGVVYEYKAGSWNPVNE